MAWHGGGFYTLDGECKRGKMVIMEGLGFVCSCRSACVEDLVVFALKGLLSVPTRDETWTTYNIYIQ